MDIPIRETYLIIHRPPELMAAEHNLAAAVSLSPVYARILQRSMYFPLSRAQGMPRLMGMVATAGSINLFMVSPISAARVTQRYNKTGFNLESLQQIESPEKAMGLCKKFAQGKHLALGPSETITRGLQRYRCALPSQNVATLDPTEAQIFVFVGPDMIICGMPLAGVANKGSVEVTICRMAQTFSVRCFCAKWDFGSSSSLKTSTRPVCLIEINTGSSYNNIQGFMQSGDNTSHRTQGEVAVMFLPRRTIFSSFRKRYTRSNNKGCTQVLGQINGACHHIAPMTKPLNSQSGWNFMDSIPPSTTAALKIRKIENSFQRFYNVDKEVSHF
ncbi:hypothetical protein NC652_028742 [Populus alba x Populus x berolinensis]|nr:hypothetical protein NC652_028742 [Populus alba x Populus x berolinensis]